MADLRWDSKAGVIALVVLLVLGISVIVAATSVQQLPCSTGGSIGDDGSEEAPGQSRDVPLPSVDPQARLRVSVVSWNSYYRNSVTNVVGGFRAIAAAGGDVVGLQEQNDVPKRRELVRRLSPTWAFVGTQTRTPIAYRADSYRLVASGVEKAHGPALVESGAGGRKVPTKWVVWVELQDLSTGATFAVVGDHKIAAVERAGHPRKDKPKRVRLWHEEDRAAARVIGRLKELGIPVLKTADENLAARRHSAFGYDELMKARGLYSNWEVLGYPDRGTHGNRLIDYVWATTRTAAPVRQRLLGKHGSDHSILLVEVDNKKMVGRAVASQVVARTRVTAPPAVPTSQTAARGGRLRQQQVANAKLVAQGVRAAGGSGRAVFVALVAAVGESDLVNVGYGDQAGPDSRGLFQQRDTWGTLAQRMNPAWSAGAFMLGPHQAGHGGLLQLKGWESLPVTLAIHRVQINANPNHYTKFESRALEIGRQAGIDFDAPSGSGAGAADPVERRDCQSDPSAPALAGPLGDGSCSLDRLHAPGRANSRDCNATLTWLDTHMKSGDSRWYRACMALVAVAYGWRYSGNDTAFIGAQRVQAASQMHTSRTGIPKGAVLWWDGRATGNRAGHVAIYDGEGYVYSNDVSGHGTIGRVPWTFPEDRWGQRFIGWSAPYFPQAG